MQSQQCARRGHIELYLHLNKLLPMLTTMIQRRTIWVLCYHDTYILMQVHVCRFVFLLCIFTVALLPTIVYFFNLLLLTSTKTEFFQALTLYLNRHNLQLDDIHCSEVTST